MNISRSALLLGAAATAVFPVHAERVPAGSAAPELAANEMLSALPVRSSPIDRLLLYWADQLVPWPALDPREVSRFETNHGIEFPDDFRQYLLRAKGLPVNGDHEVFDFWPLERLERYEDTSIFIFADYLVECWWFGIDLSPGSDHSVFLSGAHGGWVLMGSFADFVALYVHEDFWSWRVAKLSPNKAATLNVEPRVRGLSALELQVRMINDERPILRSRR